MATVFHGDEWKNCSGTATRPTRHQEQCRIDIEYANARMNLGEWRRQTDELGNPKIWTATGKITEPSLNGSTG